MLRGSLKKRAREQGRGEQRLGARAEPGPEAEAGTEGILVFDLLL